MIKNILFDMGGVLIDWAPFDLINSVGIYGDDANLLYEELFKEYEWIALDAGTMDEDEVYNAVSKRLDPSLHEALEFIIKKWWTLPFKVKEGISELIEELHNNGYKIYLLSNANLRQLEYFSKIPGSEYFDGRITSATIKMVKPDKSIYQYICDEYKLNKEECFFIDDNNMNVYQAKIFGFKACVFHNTKRLRKIMYEEGIKVNYD